IHLPLHAPVLRPGFPTQDKVKTYSETLIFHFLPVRNFLHKCSVSFYTNVLGLQEVGKLYPNRKITKIKSDCLKMFHILFCIAVIQTRLKILSIYAQYQLFYSAISPQIEYLSGSHTQRHCQI